MTQDVFDDLARVEQRLAELFPDLQDIAPLRHLATGSQQRSPGDSRWSHLSIGEECPGVGKLRTRGEVTSGSSSAR